MRALPEFVKYTAICWKRNATVLDSVLHNKRQQICPRAGEQTKDKNVSRSFEFRKECT